MVQSKAATVDDYIAEAGPERRAALQGLRDLCRRRLSGWQEQIRWGMAVYAKGDDAFFAFASQKQYIAVYGLTQVVLDANAPALAGLDRGKGCLRFRKPEQVDISLLEDLMNQALKSRPGC